MRSAQLLGREYPDYERIACVSEGRVAIALSRGGAKKPYPHKEPNEDAVCFAHGGAGALLAVADGHAGAEAAQLAIETLLRGFAPAWTGHAPSHEEWPALAREAVEAVHAGIIDLGVRHASEARTTLSFALVGGDSLHWALAGDSHVFAAGEVDAHEPSPAEPPLFFLGSARHAAADLVVRCGSTPLAGLRAVVVASDGLSEQGIGVADPAAAVAAAIGEAREAAEPSLSAARGLARAAVDAHREQKAGDNIATAVCWLGAR